MVRGYVAGVNEYLRDIGGADGVKDPTCKGAGYLKPDVTAKDLWYGVYAANLLASTGRLRAADRRRRSADPRRPGAARVRRGGGFAEPPADAALRRRS